MLLLSEVAPNSHTNRHWWDGKQRLLWVLIGDGLPVVPEPKACVWNVRFSEHWCCLPAEEWAFLAMGCWLEEVTGLLSGWITPEEEKEDSASRSYSMGIPRNFHNASLSPFPICSPPCVCQHTLSFHKNHLKEGDPNQWLAHTDVWVPEPRSLTFTCCLFYQSIRLHLKRWPTTHRRSSSTFPETSPALGSGQPSSISSAFLKRKQRRLTKFRSPYTAPRSRSLSSSTQPSAACSIRKRSKDSERQTIHLQEEMSVGYS